MAKNPGGSAAAGGASFQARVAAWYAVRLLADDYAEPLPGLPAHARPAELWCETDKPLDDIEVCASDGSRLLIQAKRSLGASRKENSELAKVARQLVAAAEEDSHAALVIAVGPATGQPIARHLRELLDDLRDLPASAPLSAALSSRVRCDVLDTLTAHLNREWKQAYDKPLTAGSLRQLLLPAHVQVFEVEPGERDAREAERILRSTVLARANQAALAWSVLVEHCSDLAKRQLGSDLAGLQKALHYKGIELQAAPRFRHDIERLKHYSTQTLHRLERRSRIELDGKMLSLQREAPVLLLGQARTGSLVVMGDPGIGKTACVVAAARELARDRDVVVIAADQLEARSGVELMAELGLHSRLEEILAGWPGGPATLVVDGLDGARDELTRRTLLAVIEAVVAQDGRWSVLTSIRTYDLRYSQELPGLFPARPRSDEAQAPNHDEEFSRLRHFRVPGLEQAELDQLATVRPSLHSRLAAAPKAVRQLAKVPFNLRLLAELEPLGALSRNRLRAVDTQLDLLEAYWRERVLSPGSQASQREAVLEAVCEGMLTAGRLQVPRSALRLPGLVDQLEGLLHDHILVERRLPTALTDRERLSFDHNILFDYAVARLLLRGDQEALVERLMEAPTLLLRIRPSVSLHFRWLWQTDPGRHEFWDPCLKLAAAEVSELAKTVAPGVTVELAKGASDFDRLWQALDDGTPGAELTLRHVVGAVFTEEGPERLVGKASPWPEFAAALSQRLERGHYYLLRGLLLHLFDHYAVAAEAEGERLGAAARRLLEAGWSHPRDGRVVTAALPLVAESFDSDSAASRRLIRRALEPAHVAEHGWEELFHLANAAEPLLGREAELVAEIFRAAFGHQESSDEPTPMGSSQLVPLRSTRAQDFSMARHCLEELFPKLLGRVPALATEILSTAVAVYAGEKYGPYPRSRSRFRLNGRRCVVLSHASYIWDSGTAHDEVEKLLLHLETFLASPAPGGVLGQVVGQLAECPTPAALWSRLLSAAARQPRRFIPLLGDLLEKPQLYSDIELHYKLGRFLEAGFPLLPTERRRRVERALMAVPREYEPDRREDGERARDQLLSTLPAEMLSSPTLARRGLELQADERAPGLRPPFRLSISAGEVTDEDLRFELGGADPNHPANARLRQLWSQLKQFQEEHQNKLPDAAARRRALPRIRALDQALRTSTGRAAHPAVKERALGELADAAACMASAATAIAPATAALVKSILLRASRGSSPGEDEDSKRFDDFPSWGTPSSRIEATQGLLELCRAPRYADVKVLAAIERLSGDAVVSVRFAVAQRLSLLPITSTARAWRIAERMAREETSAAVLQALIRSLDRMVRLDRERALGLVVAIGEHECNCSQPRERVMTAALKDLSLFWVWQAAPEGREASAMLEADPAARHDTIGHLTHELRAAMIHGPPETATAAQAEIRARALELCYRLVVAALAQMEEIEQREGADANQWQQAAVEAWRAAASVADSVGDAIYFASGVFNERQGREPEGDAGDYQQRARLYREAWATLELLAGVGHAPLAHRLLETFEGCIEEDPAGVFRLCATTVQASRAYGYQLETLAEGLVVRIIQRYLAEHRALFEDPELGAQLMATLDVFVAAGWPRARQLVFGLDELFR